ncbi:hypothetical protein V6N13_083548 [Hibiscus sabdariffa]
MEKMNNAFEKMKMLVGIEVEDEQEQPAIEDGNSFSFMDDFNRQCTLTTKQVLWICDLLGCWLSLYIPVYPCFLPSNQVWNHIYIWQFACTWKMLSWSLLYGSTAFLIGPKRQVSMMLDPVRIYATALYLASMIIALFCAFYVHNKLLTLLAIILEFGALICRRRVHHLECRRFDLSCAVVVAVVLCTVGSNIRKPLSHCPCQTATTVFLCQRRRRPSLSRHRLGG